MSKFITAALLGGTLIYLIVPDGALTQQANTVLAASAATTRHTPAASTPRADPVLAAAYDAGVAMAAQLCRLRSYGWAELFYNRLADPTIPPSEGLAGRVQIAFHRGRDTYWLVLGPSGPGDARCTKLLNSGELDRLDRVEISITGNYH